MKRLYFLITIILIAHPIYAQLFINEFMADNDQIIADESGEYDDWIEIYNTEEFDINLSGYFLTDDLTDPTQWAFSNVIIPAKGYLLIWADEDLNQPGLHTNFKLSKDGEQIGLYNGRDYIDSITFDIQSTDISYGRQEDGAANWVFFEAPNNPSTPGARNVYTFVETLNPPNFSIAEGFYTGNISVTLSTDEPGVVIYYTLDGSLPMTSKTQYLNPIFLSSSTTIRAISYKEIVSANDLISKVITKCYLLDVNNTMPLIDIACDPDEHDNIYSSAQPGEEHPSIQAHYKHFDSGHVIRGDLPIALSMRGAYSLLSPKESYKVEFSLQSLPYDLFDQEYNYPRSNELPTSFHSYTLNGMAADYSLIRNYLSFQLLRNAGANSAQVSFARLFINGNDRGIYVPIEQVDQWFVRSRFNDEDYDIIKTGPSHDCPLTTKNEGGAYFELKEGDFNAFNDFIVWLNDRDHSFEELSAKIDIPSFLFYDLMCRYSNSKDGYDINYYLIRNRETTDSKWIILIWDADESFGWDSEFVGDWYPYNEAFSQLRQTEEYINLYQNKLADLVNSSWSRSSVETLVEKIETLFQTDNPDDEEIWDDKWYSYGEAVIPGFAEDPNYNPLSRYTQFSYIKPWIGDRINYLLGLWQYGTALLTIDPSIACNGIIKLNTLNLTNCPWSGIFFKQIPIPLTAIPTPGYHFVGWSDPSLPQTEAISIILTSDYTIHAIFEADDTFEVVINEINYNSDGDFNPEDWIELYNPSDEAIDVSGWHLKDDDTAHDFIFSSGTILGANGYLVVCREPVLFHDLFPEVTNYIGNLDFGLSAEGDQVRLFSRSLLLIDSVSYDNEAPWPTEPDGNGSTLELVNWDWDNTIPENWQASLGHGTPGQINSIPIIINEINYNSAVDFNPEDWIELYNPSNRTVDLSGWHFKDDDDAHDYIFPAATTIGPCGFLILCYNQANFQSCFPGVINIVGDFDFGLSGGGDLLRIFNASLILIDSVQYDDTAPWPTEPDGNGPTLELIDPDLDNTLAANWQASANHGTPGQPNSAIIQFLYDFPVETGGWYLISLPAILQNAQINTLFPAALSALSWETDHYIQVTELGTSEGYWLAIPSSWSGTIQGAPVKKFTEHYKQGWHMIGSVSDSVDFSNPNDQPDGSVLSPAYRYDTALGEYVPADKLVPGQGYWIAVIQECDLTIGETSSSLSKPIAEADKEAFYGRFGSQPPHPPYLNWQAKEITAIPEKCALLQNFPNPFNGQTVIRYQLPKSSRVILKIYNTLGKEVRTLVNEEKEAGYHWINWNSKNNDGQELSSGIYIYRIQSGDFVMTKKMVFIM